MTANLQPSTKPVLLIVLDQYSFEVLDQYRLPTPSRVINRDLGSTPTVSDNGTDMVPRQ